MYGEQEEQNGSTHIIGMDEKSRGQCTCVEHMPHILHSHVRASIRHSSAGVYLRRPQGECVLAKVRNLTVALSDVRGNVKSSRVRAICVQLAGVSVCVRKTTRKSSS